MTSVPGMHRFAEAIDEERRNQIRKWGDQHHPDGTGRTVDIYLRDDAIHETQSAAARGEVTWAMILKEEVFEAFAERDPEHLRIELIQAGAVIAAWLADMDTRG